MRESYGNFWDLASDYDHIVITTNGYVKKNGEAVLGRGIAKEAVEKFPQLPYKLGQRILQHGNLPFGFSINSKYQNGETDLIGPIEFTGKILVCLPVKPAIGPNGEMGWKAKADIELIVDSLKKLKEGVDYYQSRILSGLGFLTLERGEQARVILPRPGCGNGKLKWEEVKPIIEPLLDDRFTVVTW